jgi:hypothetical protein
MLNSVTPFFIVDDLAKTLEFYQSRLAFNVLYKGGDENGDFWAMLGRDRVMLMFNLTSIHSPITRVMNGQPGMLTYLQPIPILYTPSCAPRTFPCIENWPIRMTDLGLSRSQITMGMCCVLAVRSKSSTPSRL